MAWVIGLADIDEIITIERAGYRIERDLRLGDLQPTKFCHHDKNNTLIAVFVDCDISDLLMMEKEDSFTSTGEKEGR